MTTCTLKTLTPPLSFQCADEAPVQANENSDSIGPLPPDGEVRNHALYVFWSWPDVQNVPLTSMLPSLDLTQKWTTPL